MTGASGTPEARSPAIRGNHGHTANRRDRAKRSGRKNRAHRITIEGLPKCVHPRHWR